MSQQPAFHYDPPQTPCKYVAYRSEPWRVGNPETGEAIDGFRSSIYIEEYPTIKIASFTVKDVVHGGEQFQIGSVKFDAASAGVRNFVRDFTASVKADPEVVQLLGYAQQHGTPLMVVIETVRKVRGANGDRIDPLAYIHDLRGASTDGKGGNANMTGDNCKKVLVGIGAAGRPETFRVTSEVHTDPTEWVALRRNRDHTLPPPGFRVLAGGVVPVAPEGAPTIDVSTLADQVAARLAQATPAAPGAAVDGAAEARPRPALRDRHSTEAKPTDPWNSDGRVNHGSYLASKWRATFSAALQLVNVAAPTMLGGDQEQAAWSLVPCLMWMSDHAQVAAYGPGSRADRNARSHMEAARWCEVVYNELAGLPGGEQFAFTAEVLRDSAAGKAWARAVAAKAGAMMAHAASGIADYMSPAADAPAAPQHATATPEAAPAARQQPSPAAAASGDPNATVGGNGTHTQRWVALLTAANAAHAPERFTPILMAQFGTTNVDAVPADRFHQIMTAWESDVRRFVYAAAQQSTHAPAR